MRLILFLALLLQTACTAQMAQPQKAQRLPLQKTQFTLAPPLHYEHRTSGVNQKTKEPVTFDPKPQVVLVDAKSGKYAFKWIGYDGKEKVIEYQRHDAVDIVVAALVEKMPDGNYIYTYNVESLPTSGTFLTYLMVQTFADDAKGHQDKGLFIGEMGSNIPQFREGRWIAFSMSSYQPEVAPGRSIKLKILSSALPGLVQCRAYGGSSTIKGAGEHMPTELEKAMPGYSVLPRGFTIGPVANLKNLSIENRVKYVSDALPQMRELGWLSDSALEWYKQHLKPEQLDEVLKRAAQDLKAERITSEVFAMIEAVDD